MRDMTRSLVLGALLGVVAALAADTPSPLFAQAGSQPESTHLNGTWRLDLARSRYSPGPPPTRETRTNVRDKDGVAGVIRRLHADGREEVIEYRADYDRDYPVFGTTAYDMLRLTRVDDRTVEAVLSHAGRVFGLARRVISQDGQTMTVSFRRGDTSPPVNTVAVYRKDPP
jgi:hypothetical protein